MVFLAESVLNHKPGGFAPRRRLGALCSLAVQESAESGKGVYLGRAGMVRFSTAVTRPPLSSAAEVYPGAPWMVNLTDQRPRITDQKRGTSDDLLIDHCSLEIERSTCQGMTLDPVTGLYYTRNRNYDPSLGSVLRQEPKSRLSAGVAHREINQDPLQYINGANTYRFVMGNPVNATDPLGLELASQSGPWGVPPIQQQPPTLSGLLQDAQAATADAWSGLSNGWNGFNNWAVAATNGLGNLINKIPALGMVLPGDEFAPEGKVIGETGEQLAKDIKPKAEPEPETKGPARKAYPDEGHHFLPKQFADRFNKVGLNPEDFVEPLPKDVHRLRPGGIHTGPYEGSSNGQWQQFFNDNPNYTQQDVLNQLAKMKQSFGVK